MGFTSIYSKLQDEESRNIFKIKQMLQQNNDKLAFAKKMLKLHPDMRFSEIDSFITRTGVKKLCVFGESEHDDYMYQVLLSAGFDVCRVKYIDELKNNCSQGYIVFNETSIESLKALGIESSKILYSRRPFTGRIGWQYFDVFAKQKRILC